jgi:hypothetical protein
VTPPVLEIAQRHELRILLLRQILPDEALQHGVDVVPIAK